MLVKSLDRSGVARPHDGCRSIQAAPHEPSPHQEIRWWRRRQSPSGNYPQMKPSRLDFFRLDHDSEYNYEMIVMLRAWLSSKLYLLRTNWYFKERSVFVIFSRQVDFEQSSFVEVNNWIGNNDVRVLLIFETDAVKRFTLFRLTVRYFAHGGFFHCRWVLKCGAAEECFQSTIKSFLSSFCGVAHTGRNHTNDLICALLFCVIFCLAKHSLHEFPLN
jgi:hypothetical protein